MADDHGRRFAHLGAQTVETLRGLRDAADRIREAALEQGNDALAAREAAHIIAIEERLAVLRDRVGRVQDHRNMPEPGEDGRRG